MEFEKELLPNNDFSQITPLEWESQLNELLNKGHYQAILSQPQYSSHKNEQLLRIQKHYQGMACVYQDQFELAHKYYSEALHLGDNIQLYMDLACLYYQTNKIDLWRKAYKKVEQLKTDLNKKLSLKTLFKVDITLGKFLEEEGKIAEAKTLYESLYKTAGNSDLFRIPFYNNLIQLLRVTSVYFPKDPQMPNYYSQLLGCDPSSLNYDLSIEMEHALMMAELCLVGPEHALIRLNQCLTDPLITPMDKSFFLSEYLEESYLRGYNFTKVYQQYINLTKETENLFEQNLFEIMDSLTHSLPVSLGNSSSAHLSLASFIRLLTIQTRANLHSPIHSEFKNKLFLVLGSLSLESKNVWSNRYQPIQEKRNLSIEFDDVEKTLSFDNQTVDLSRKKGLVNILKYLMKHPQKTPLEQAIYELWKAEYSPDYYHRLRISAHRLNKILMDLTGIEKVIDVDSQEVSLKETLSFVSKT